MMTPGEFLAILRGEVSANGSRQRKPKLPAAIVDKDQVEHKAEFTISTDVGGKGQQGVLSIVVTGSACRLEDLQMALAAEVHKWRATSPKAKDKRPCGCRDAG